MITKQNKYLNLLKKDLLLSKNLLLLFLYFLVLTMCFPLFFKKFSSKTILNIFPVITILQMIALNSLQIFTSEKCKGNELIITTTYTRNDLVYSKYIFIYGLTLCALIGAYVTFGCIYCVETINFSVLLSKIFLTCIADAILLLLSFKIDNNLQYSMLGVIFITPLTSFIQAVDVLFAMVNPMIFVSMTVLLTVLIVAVSLKFSKKLYSKKDL